jgi:hypothetical protein
MRSEKRLDLALQFWIAFGHLREIALPLRRGKVQSLV